MCAAIVGYWGQGELLQTVSAGVFISSRPTTNTAITPLLLLG